MRRWFLSYNSQDLGLMQSLEAALRRRDPEAHLYFAPKSERAGGFWLPSLAREINEATAFVLLVGEKGVGHWQVLEYNEALARRVKEPDFPRIKALLPVITCEVEQFLTSQRSIPWPERDRVTLVG